MFKFPYFRGKGFLSFIWGVLLGTGIHAQPYIPAGVDLTSSGAALVTQAGSDTTGYLYLAGSFSGRLDFLGKSVRAAGKQGVFWCRADNNGRADRLVALGGSGYCELQAAAFRSGGNALLILYYRDTLVCGDTVFTASGRGGVVLVHLNLSGEITAVNRITDYLRGRIRAVTADTSGTVWLGGHFRKIRLAGTMYRSRGRRDALLLSVQPDGKITPLIWGGDGEEDISALDADSGGLYLSGIFDHTLVAGDTLLDSGGRKALFLARRDAASQKAAFTLLASAGDLSLTATLRPPQGYPLWAGWFSGSLHTRDTSVIAAGNRDGFVLALRPDNHNSLFTLGGASDDAVRTLACDNTGKLFMTASFKQQLLLRGDTLTADDRYADMLFARFDTTFSLPWVRQVSGRSEENNTVMTVTADGSVWLGGYMFDRLTVRDCDEFAGAQGEEGSYLLRFMDPCLLLHFDLPAEKTICSGTTDTLDAGAGYESYLWMPGAYAGRKLPVRDTGLYVAEITGRYGCKARDTVRVKADSVSMTFEVTEETLPEGNNGAVEMTVLTGKPPFRIYWNTGETTEDIGFLQAGTYSVTVTDSLGCGAEKEVEVPLHDLTAVYDLYNYPNPFGDLTRIIYSLPEGTDISISIYDPAGRKLFVLREHSSAKGIHSFEWSRKHLKEGVYYLRMQSRFGQLSRKIVILKQP